MSSRKSHFNIYHYINQFEFCNVEFMWVLGDVITYKCGNSCVVHNKHAVPNNHNMLAAFIQEYEYPVFIPT